VMKGPGIPAGRRDDLTIYDIAPTILGVAGLEPEPEMRGRAISREVERL
jgi:arylsulfatase A-like enzyme